MGVSDFSFFSINPHVYLFLYSAEISVGRQGGEESGVVGVASKQVRGGPFREADRNRSINVSNLSQIFAFFGIDIYFGKKEAFLCLRSGEKNNN